MRRTRSFFLSLGLLSTLVLGAAQAVYAGGSVDPGSLQPPPPPGAQCSADGSWVICATTFDATYANEPAFVLPCGQVYTSATDLRDGRRWYANGLLVRRHVVQDAAGTFSLSPVGNAPALTFVSHTEWGEVYTIPGDLASAVGHQAGTDLLVKSPGGGVVAHISGRTNADEEFSGLFVAPDDPANATSLCRALGA